jgi:hypothetical protein
MMRIRTVVAILVLSVSAYAQAPASVSKPNQAHEKFKKSLLKKCEDEGVAESCFQYGEITKESENAIEQKKSSYYIRRACMMAYAPACGRANVTAAGAKSKREPGSVPCITAESAGEISLAPVAGGEQGQKISSVDNPVLQSAGVKPGDVIMTINGRPFSSAGQFAQELSDSDNVEIEVNRGGVVTPLNVKCP